MTEEPHDPAAGLVPKILAAWNLFGPGDYHRAMDAWREVARDYPWHPSGHLGILLCHIRLLNLDLAEDMRCLALRIWPDDVDVLAMKPQILGAQGRWREALAEWQTLRARFPQNIGVQQDLRLAVWQVQQLAMEDDPGAQLPVDVGHVDDPATRSLLLRFESLGDNCEFGLLQQRYEAEPLGLMRWTGANAEATARLFESRLEGFGEDDNIEIDRYSHGEYCVRDRLHGLGPFHTFVSGALADPAKFKADHARRMRWLRDKLLGDIADGEKIFIYKSSVPMDEAELQRLHRAFRALGPAPLLVVREAEPEHPPGSVEQRGDGLLTGYLAYTSPRAAPGIEPWDMDSANWISICQEALTFIV